jgi:hypothetical protein
MPTSLSVVALPHLLNITTKVKFIGWKNSKFELIAKVQTFLSFMLIWYGLQSFFSLQNLWCSQIKLNLSIDQTWKCKNLGILLYLGFLSEHVVKIWWFEFLSEIYQIKAILSK